MRSLLAHALAGLAACLVVQACGGPRGGCATERWEGRCQLRSMLRVREREFPVPQVTLQIIYSPVPNSSYPQFTPPDHIEEVALLASQEGAFRDHVEQNADVACQLQPPPPSSCVPGQLKLEVPPFDASRTAEPEPVRGCAQIDAASSQERLPALMANPGNDFPEAFQFEEHSAELSPSGRELVTRVAQRLASDPSIECLAIVGELSYGEKLTTAAERARVVLRSLLEQGVDGSRLTTIVPTSPLSATAETEKTVNPTERRARVRVLLRTPTP